MCVCVHVCVRNSARETDFFCVMYFALQSNYSNNVFAAVQNIEGNLNPQSLANIKFELKLLQ